MKNKSILYFDRPGKSCTAQCLKAAAERAAELGIDKLVVATASGQTALELCKLVKKGTIVIGVGYSADYAAKWGGLEAKITSKASKYGAEFITGGHAFGGINGAIQKKFGGITPNKIIENTFYTLGQGFKVAAEVAVMAADQGRVMAGKPVIAIGGTAEGADTALVLLPAYSADFFSLKIKEIICKPG